MSRSGAVTLDWAEGRYDFRLAWGNLIALQEKCDAGPAHVLERLHRGHWRVQDLEATIFQGLLGGGLAPAEARRLVDTYVRQMPLAENVLVAIAILSAAILGAPDEPPEQMPGKSEGATLGQPCPGES